jgi:NAD(P)H dehydrogenase (quinone)
MKPKILVIGATGRVGSQVVSQLTKHQENVDVRLASRDSEDIKKWQSNGQDSVLLDLNDSATFSAALHGIDRLFLLTTYSSDMLHQSKTLVDAAQQAGVTHIVHLGVFTSRRDKIPHFNWHDLVERYIETSGMAWTHLHPNVIADSSLVTDPPITETGSFSVFWGNALQGWVFAEDIAEVAAMVLNEGPDKHASKEYWMSTEVLTGPQVAEIVSKTSGL